MNILAAKIRDNLERYGRFQLVSSDLPWLHEMFSALEEREKLREALFYARDTLFVLPSVVTDDVDLRIEKAIAMADAALQPPPEEPK